ncbi:hypothetical protein XENOCAPTIV_029051 [Xenoophorus captivus]|uniref:Uncharacterized protein n=1 Tax=Xenoophorus captivus TaxID=1517983 RepID=A0ABV0QKY6_9TELE
MNNGLTGKAVKVEGLSTSALIKSLSTRVMLSNHLLPKGTKMRVNLEDQGRQKVSFSFSQTKKPLQSSFFISASPDTTVAEPHNASSQSILDKVGKNTENKMEQKQTVLVPVSTPETRSQTSVSSSTRLKKNLGKMHFKKQILSVSVTEEKPKPDSSEELLTSESEVLQISSSDTELPAPPSENIIIDSPSKNATTEASETKEDPNLKKPASSSGKDGDSSSCTDRDYNVYKRKTRSQSDSATPCSEPDGDVTNVSSIRKSNDSKSKTNSDSRSKEAKRSSSNSHVGEKEKNSSKRTETQETSSSYTKSDRDSRITSSRSSRSDKDRRRSRSRSRSRSRGSRTSSSLSRSERSRCDRVSRSERLYYHESDRRSHRSSPRREKRRSRSRTERTRYSSDSEDDHRKTRTRTGGSSRSSNYSHKVSQSSSYSRSEKSSKSLASPHSSEIDKRTQSSKSERTSKRSSDSDSQHRCSPDLDSSNRKSSSHHKSETSTKFSSSSTYSKSQLRDKHRKNSSCDSEGEYKAKSQPYDKNSSSLEKSKDFHEKTSRSDSKQVTPSRSSVKSPRHHRQSDDMFHSPAKAPSCATTAEFSPLTEREKSDSEPGEDARGGQGVKEMVLSTEESLPESLGKTEQETKAVLELETQNASATTPIEDLMPVGITLENVCNVKASEPDVSLNAAVVNSGKSEDSLLCEKDDTVLKPSLDATETNITAVLNSGKREDSIICEKDDEVLKPSLDATEANITHEIQLNTNTEIVESNEVLAAEKQFDPHKSDLSFLEAESQLLVGQQSKDGAKKSACTTRKSRWDIVGQDLCESGNSNRAICADSNLSPKKVISFKKIEFSKDCAQQDLGSKGNIQSRDAKHSSLELDASLVTFKCEDQSKPSPASTSIDHCDLNRATSQKPNTDDPPPINNQISQVHSAALGHIQSSDACDSKSKESTHSSKSDTRTLINQDVLATPSDASDSDNSAYDSDCDKAIKQFHSVVVVPKHSSLTKDVEDGHASLCTPLHLSELPNAQMGTANQATAQQTQPTTTSLVESPHISVLCQSQSNMIDSTSHSEGSSTVSGQLFVADHNGPQGGATDSIPLLNNSRQCEQSLKQHEISSQGEQVHLQYQPNTFSDNLNKMSFSLGWDFSQPEQPTSTCQQPDSSHGPQLNTKATADDSKEPEQRLSIHSGTHQSPNIQTIKRLYLHTHEHYQEPSGEIHPDSLTNDHDDYSVEKSSGHSKALNTPGSASSVQGHEISSNSRGSAVFDPPREDNLRPHRGRGPPKKRRPEIESDSDNEAEAGPSGKRERQGDVAVSKEAPVKAEADRPSLTLRNFQDASRWKDLAKTKKMPPYFDLIEENMYLTER